MNQTIKQQWVAALRSGQYKQGKGKLRRASSEGDLYCCLGVLCDLLAPNEWKKVEPYDYYAIDELGAFLPGALRRSVGLDGATESELVHMNDSSGSSFAKIASWIEERL
jgi:hypothetical protein